MDYITVYDFLNVSIRIEWIIVLIVIFFATTIYLAIREKKTKPNHLTIGIFIFLGIFFFGIIKVHIYDFYKTKSLIKQNNFKIVEGVIENFTPMCPSGKRYESFDVNGIIFEYSEYNISHNGFNKISLENGPIKKNGQKVRLSYITVDDKNIILKIELNIEER